MRDPYQVLGIPSTATDEEVKKAYRNLARKYHPDNYHDNPLEDLAQERMKEINEAYETIRNQRKAAQSGGQSGYGSGYNPGYGAGYNTGYNTGYSGAYGAAWQRIRLAISQGNLNLAEELLNAQTDHNGEWNFLKGAVCYKRGWMDEARRYYETAVQMDPGNAEYQRAWICKRKRRGVPPQRIRACVHRQLCRRQLHQPLRRLRLHELPVWRRRILFLLLRDDR